jgi:hypothetical protein
MAIMLAAELLTLEESVRQDEERPHNQRLHLSAAAVASGQYDTSPRGRRG